MAPATLAISLQTAMPCSCSLQVLLVGTPSVTQQREIDKARAVGFQRAPESIDGVTPPMHKWVLHIPQVLSVGRCPHRQLLTWLQCKAAAPAASN